MTKEEFLQSGLMQLYVLGLVSPAERKIVKEFAQKYPDIKAQLERAVNGIEYYAEEKTQLPSRKKGNPYREDFGSGSGSGWLGIFIVLMIGGVLGGVVVYFY